MAASGTPLQLDLKAILRARLPRRVSRLVPGFAISLLEKLIRQDGLNRLLREAYPAEGSVFSASILRQLGITVEVKGLEKLEGRGRLIFASNHPLGGLDGITMVKILGETYGDDNIRVMVNDMLMNVEPLAGVFLPINKYGSQARRSAVLINEAFASDRHICVYPAGLVSRLSADGHIRDLQWQKSVVAKAIEFDRDIVPVRFEAQNTDRFYRLARLRKQLGIKINLEQALLPGEMFSQEGEHFRVVFGEPMTSASLRASGVSPAVLAERLRLHVYSV